MAKNDAPQDQYDQGYEGYKASKPKDDPYGSYGQQQQQSYQAPDSYQQSGYGQQQQQQFAPYQAPLSAAMGGTNAEDPTSIGLSGRIEALLSYLFRLAWRHLFLPVRAQESLCAFRRRTIVPVFCACLHRLWHSQIYRRYSRRHPVWDWATAWFAFRHHRHDLWYPDLPDLGLPDNSSRCAARPCACPSSAAMPRLSLIAPRAAGAHNPFG